MTPTPEMIATANGTADVEPFFTEACDGFTRTTEALMWCSETIKKAKAEGATSYRVTLLDYSDDFSYALVEAWQSIPSAFGEPRIGSVEARCALF